MTFLICWVMHAQCDPN